MDADISSTTSPWIGSSRVLLVLMMSLPSSLLWTNIQGATLSDYSSKRQVKQNRPGNPILDVYLREYKPSFFRMMSNDQEFFCFVKDLFCHFLMFAPFLKSEIWRKKVGYLLPVICWKMTCFCCWKLWYIVAKRRDCIVVNNILAKDYYLQIYSDLAINKQIKFRDWKISFGLG